jgi:glutathione-regulated potassium-efflux system ancillary protein KefC
MTTPDLLHNAVYYLSAAVIMVPVARALGLGAVIGYLAAGILIGPWGIGLITDTEAILHFSEFGVVLLLFLVGLELSPKTLWTLKKSIFGLGGGQLLLSLALLVPLFLVTGFEWKTALVGGLALSLSSTAMALQILQEKNLLPTRAGQNGFAILLCQDLAVIPIMALIPLLVAGVTDSGDPAWIDVLKAAGVITGVIVIGHYALHYILRLIAKTEMQEIFTAFTLLLVIGIALLMEIVGLSMALGTFLAGLLLADSEYRHALETVIDPLKGLLMGLFFLAVGMSIDFGLLAREPWLILLLVAALVVLKAIVLYVLGRFAGNPRCQNSFFTVLLSQGGEFGFVIFSVATAGKVIPVEDANLLILVIALSMLTTPFLMVLNDRFIEPRFAETVGELPADEIDDHDNPVIIAGFGRFGQIVGRLLHAHRIGVTLLDHDPDHIERIRLYGFKVFFGDATRLDLLQAAGADRAKLLVIAVDDKETANHIAEIARQHFPSLKIIARAWDMTHLFDYLDMGITEAYRETFDSAMAAAEASLRTLGYDAGEVHRAAERFREHDHEVIRRMHAVRDHGVEALASTSKELREELAELFAEDEELLEPLREQADQRPV